MEGSYASSSLQSYSQSASVSQANTINSPAPGLSASSAVDGASSASVQPNRYTPDPPAEQQQAPVITPTGYVPVQASTQAPKSSGGYVPVSQRQEPPKQAPAPTFTQS